MSDSATYLESVKTGAMIRLAGATPEVIDSEMRWVVSEFLADTRLWMERISVTLLAGQTEYALALGDDTESVTMIFRAEFNGRTLGHNIPPADSNTGAPARIALKTDRIILIYPQPDTEAVATPLLIDVCKTLLPTSSATVPEIIRPFHSAILLGLLARMYAITDKPWTDLRMAAAMTSAYVGACTEIRHQVEKGRTFGSVYARPVKAFM